MRLFKTMSIVFFLMMLGRSSMVQADTIFVDADAEPGGNGKSWQTAYDDLQDALAVAQAGDDIWVAEGRYTPAPPEGKREATFQLISGVGIYGGFVGKEQRREERDPQANVTILSGDLNDNDKPNFENNGENSLHVVTGSGTDETAILDGFTITAGNANRQGHIQSDGGGMLNLGGRPTLTACSFLRNFARSSGGGMYTSDSGDVTLTDCRFTANQASDGGGGMSLNVSSPTLVNCTFSRNVNGWLGGAMYVVGGSPTLTGCKFIENRDGGAGGAIWSKGGRMTLTDCVFRNNTAEFSGGGMSFYAGRFVLTNCLFVGNSSLGHEGGGGAMQFSEGNPELTNCTFSQNRAVALGGAIRIGGRAKPVFTNCILWGNTDRNGMGESSQVALWDDAIRINYSSVQGWTGKMGGEGNIGDDPRFVDPENGNFRLADGSPSIDAANSDAVLDGVETDLDGNPRFLDDPDTENTGRGRGCPVDMGVYEFQDGDCHCTAKEKLKAKCRGGKGKNKIKATLKRAEPQATVTFRLDGDPDTDIRKTVSDRGKAKAKFKRVPDGDHTVEIVECGVRKMMECP